MSEYSSSMKFSIKRKVGLLINPFAGIGGALALKGSDGEQIRERAMEAGATQQAMNKADRALELCTSLINQIAIYTGSHNLGENVSTARGFETHVVYSSISDTTEESDSVALIKALMAHQVDIILFAGGDGTARLLYDHIDSSTPVIGVPAGCKIHSGVYAITPEAAGTVLKKHINGELLSLMSSEVRDIDETLFRQGKVSAKHYGDMLVPNDLNYIQAVKMGGKESPELLIEEFADYLDELMHTHSDDYFVIASGSTINNMMQSLDLPNTLLGIDVVKNHEVIAQDVTAEHLLKITNGKPVKLVITVIGGQGHLFGRGNQQLSPAFIRRLEKDDMFIFATKEKILGLKQQGLISDSSDPLLDESMAGAISIITGYKDHTLYFVRGLQ